MACAAPTSELHVGDCLRPLPNLRQTLDREGRTTHRYPAIGAVMARPLVARRSRPARSHPPQYGHGQARRKCEGKEHSLVDSADASAQRRATHRCRRMPTRRERARHTNLSFSTATFVSLRMAVLAAANAAAPSPAAKSAITIPA